MSDWIETQRERLDFADFLVTLSPAEWDSVTPEDGRRVRDVVAHVIQGATQSTGSTVVGLARYSFRYDARYNAKARQGGAADSSELVAKLRAAASSQQRLLRLPGPKPAAMLARRWFAHGAIGRGAEEFREPDSTRAARGGEWARRFLMRGISATNRLVGQLDWWCLP